jgi:FkbM family methyltransferase
VEVGSYHGEEIVQFRGRVKRIYSFEPHPSKIQKIEDAIKVEGMTGIATIKNAAVTNFSGSITMYLPNGPESQQDSIGKINFNTAETLKSIVVPAVTLDDEIKGKGCLRH